MRNHGYCVPRVVNLGDGQLVCTQTIYIWRRCTVEWWECESLLLTVNLIRFEGEKKIGETIKFETKFTRYAERCNCIVVYGTKLGIWFIMCKRIQQGGKIWPQLVNGLVNTEQLAKFNWESELKTPDNIKCTRYDYEPNSVLLSTLSNIRYFKSI